jgi:hypothetical protein
MAAREWDLWCSVEGALPDEELHLLVDEADAMRSDLQAVPRVRGLPANWAICGPASLEQLPTTLAAEVTASHRQLVPRLRGGLKLQRRVYLRGGEPQLELAGFEADITIDGTVLATDGDELSLSQLGLAPGEHKIAIGGFDLHFHTIESLQPVEPRPSLGRDRVGAAVPLQPSGDLVTGALLFSGERASTHTGLIPYAHRFVKLGIPGEIGVVDGPLMAGWARAIDLPHVAIEVHAQSTHPDGDRLITEPRWVAWSTHAGKWVIAEFDWAPTERDYGAPFNPPAWKRMCEQIGARPEVWTTGRRPEDTHVVLEHWRDYCHSNIDE